MVSFLTQQCRTGSAELTNIDSGEKPPALCIIREGEVRIQAFFYLENMTSQCNLMQSYFILNQLKLRDLLSLGSFILVLKHSPLLKNWSFIMDYMPPTSILTWIEEYIHSLSATEVRRCTSAFCTSWSFWFRLRAAQYRASCSSPAWRRLSCGSLYPDHWRREREPGALPVENIKRPI